MDEVYAVIATVDKMGALGLIDTIWCKHWSIAEHDDGEYGLTTHGFRFLYLPVLDAIYKGLTDLRGSEVVTGWEAIELAQEVGVGMQPLHKYADPTEGVKYCLTLDEAEEVANEDPGLIYTVKV